MAKRKPKSTVETIIELFLDGGALTNDADYKRRQIATIRANVARVEAQASRDHARGTKYLARSAKMAGALGPTEMAELLSKAPGQLRMILIKSLDKIPPAKH
jgi:hypothetical protein